MMNFTNIAFMFVIFSTSGWILEFLYRSIRERKIKNPGLLKGPYLPIYGTEALLLANTAFILKGYPIILKAFVYLIVTTGLELTVAFICDYLSIPQLWDYSDEKFNFKGYICLKYSIYWVILAFVFEYLILPFYLKFTVNILISSKRSFSLFVLIVMLLDFIYSIFKNLLQLKENEREKFEDEFLETAREILDLPDVKKLKEYNHHNGKTRLDHVKEVAFISFVLCKKLSLDCKSTVKGALLHDLFFYDWLREGPRFHGFKHHKIALNNALKITKLNKKERDIIYKHMWPLTIIPPLYLESLIVSMVDTYCSTKDYLSFSKHTLTKEPENGGK